MATSSPAARARGYEKSDASPRGLVYFLLSIAVVLAVTSLLLVRLFKYYQKAENPGSFVATPFAGARPLPPPPRIQPDPGVDEQNYLHSQQNLLNTYGWIDRQNGIVRLPIDRAMELLLLRGLPTRPANTQQNEAPAQNRNRAANNAERQGGSIQ